MYSLLGLFALLAGGVAAISPLTIKGTKFFDSTGTQVYFKGLAYQRSTPQDPFINETQCALDAALMTSIGANAMRSYHVNPNNNHDACMQIFADAGIYLFLDVATHSTQIDGKNPQWTIPQYNAFTAIIDAFSKYDNLAGFFITNEAVTTPAEAGAAPYLKAAVRDTKAYMKQKGGRIVPMGYSAADIQSIRPMFQNYLVCGALESTIDFFAVNIYEWCGASTYETSGYSQRMAEFANYPVPVFFSEVGCNVVRPRIWSEMTAIFGPQMTPILSGAIAYEWVQEANNYGIIQYPDTTIQDGVAVPIGSPVPMQPEFDNLKSVWATVSPSKALLAAYTPPTTTLACPATTVGWSIDPSAALPPTPSSAPTTFTFPPAGTETGKAPSGGSGQGTATNGGGLGSSAGASGSASATGTATAKSASGATIMGANAVITSLAVLLSLVVGVIA